MILRNLNKNNWFKKAFQNPFDFRFVNEIIDAVNTTHDIAVAATPTYTVYTALTGQKGEGNPTATMLENTTGGTITWTRINKGIYEGVNTVPFTSATTTWFTFISAVSSGATIGSCRWLAGGKVEVRTYDAAGDLQDDLFTGSLEIRQY